jgi:hypothetical protein
MVSVLVDYFCLNLLFVVNKCDFFSYVFDQNCIFGKFLD